MYRAAILLILSLGAFAEQRMIGIGDRRISVSCDGERGRAATVIMIPAGGRTAKDWATIQPGVASFTRVCSYDHANFGASDSAPVKLQSVDEVVDDLHAWLTASGEKGPFVLVSHSNSGFYARRFFTRYSREAAGFVFVDSSHEEQALRLHEGLGEALHAWRISDCGEERALHPTRSAGRRDSSDSRCDYSARRPS